MAEISTFCKQDVMRSVRLLSKIFHQILKTMRNFFTRSGQWARWVLPVLLMAFSLNLQAQDDCAADFGAISGLHVGISDTIAGIQASEPTGLNVPDGFTVLYVLTSGEGLVIEDVNQFPYFEVTPEGQYTIHTLVYDPNTLDLSIVEFGVTTGFDVNSLLVQGGGNICAALDVAGAKFSFGPLTDPCFADAGALMAMDGACLDPATGEAMLSAVPSEAPDVPEGFSVLYVLTSGENLVIEQVNTTPDFTVDTTGRFTIHTLVYDSTTLDLGIVQPGVTTGVDVNNLLQQGGGDICGALDVAGAPFDIEECVCEADAGSLVAIMDNNNCLSLEDSLAQLTAMMADTPNVPTGYQVAYVLTSGENLVIQNLNTEPEFTVDTTGLFTIHTLVYDPNTLDLNLVEPGVTTGVDVNNLLIQGGGDICAALDVAGAPFDVEECVCEADAGSLMAIMDNDNCLSLEDGTANLSAMVADSANVPMGYQVLYVLTSGEGLVIEDVNTAPEFTVDTTGRFTIHTLVYDTATLDLGIVEIGVTTGVDVNNLLIQGGGDICAALDVAGAPFDVEECVCEADAGSLMAVMDGDNCLSLEDGTANLSAMVADSANVPMGYQVLYVLTSGENLVIEGVNSTPEFTVDTTGRFTIHTLVYNPATLDLNIVEPGVTTGVDVNNLLIQGGGDICAALDVAGAPFDVEDCACEADAGSLMAVMDGDNCLDEGAANLSATVVDSATVPMGYEVIYVLTSGEGLVIEAVNSTPEFTVDSTGRFTIHTLVYNPATLDLNIVEPGVTTGVDVNNLLIQGGGDICAALDVAGAPFDVENCTCTATAGTLMPVMDEDNCLSFDEGIANLSAMVADSASVPVGSQILYVLTSGEGLVIEDVNTAPEFTVDTTGRFTIHTLVYDPSTLDLSIVEFGVTTGVDVNNLLLQGGGDICGALDVAGAAFDVEECGCQADAGTLSFNVFAEDNCLDPATGMARVSASVDEEPVVPNGYEIIYVLTSGNDLVIEAVSDTPEFMVERTGIFTIHTLVYNPNTLDLSIVEFGVTTGVDVNGLLLQGGGDICAALDVAGAPFEVEECPCEADAGTLTADMDEDNCLGLETGVANLSASIDEQPNVPEGYELIYVLTSGSGLVIQDVNSVPEFTVDTTGRFTIHTLVYDPITLDLSIVVPGTTTGFDVNGLLKQGGGDICAALDVAGAAFDVADCPCEADAGTLTAIEDDNNCLSSEDFTAELSAAVGTEPTIPEGYELLYVLTSGDGLVIEGVSETPEFTVASSGRFTIHTLVYDPNTLDLSIVVPGETTGFDVNSLLIQGGGDICASLDVAGAQFFVVDCVCDADAGTLTPIPTCLDRDDKEATLEATINVEPTIPEGYERIYVLTSGAELTIEQVNTEPAFTVTEEGRFTIHTLVYDPNTLDLSIVEFGKTTGVDVNNLLIQGGGTICAALDVAGAAFEVELCCEGSLGKIKAFPIQCTDDGAVLNAYFERLPRLPGDLFKVLYVLTKGDDLVIIDANTSRKFTVTEPGIYRIHTLLYNPRTLKIGTIEFGKTTGFDVNALLQQGGGDICGRLDVTGARFDVSDCIQVHKDVQAFPNPTTDRVNVEFNPVLNNQPIRVDILNSSGAVIGSQNFAPGTERGEIDLSRSSQGLYMLRVSYGDTVRDWHRINKTEK